jgi:Ser/Thr protein kinase RdoA (MazF antagonist)
VAVYTDVGAEELGAFLTDYDIGELLAYKGIAEGVENSNFLVHTSRGYFILTLYERRVAAKDLPFFLGLMEHLHARGITCPQPVKNKRGEVLGRVAGRPAALITFLDGMWIRRPSAGHCAAVGEALAKLHIAGLDFGQSRANALSIDGWRARTRCSPTSRRFSRPSSNISSRPGRASCRRASSTRTSFPTTCSFSATGCRGSSISISPAPTRSPMTSRSVSTPGASRATIPST